MHQVFIFSSKSGNFVILSQNVFMLNESKKFYFLLVIGVPTLKSHDCRGNRALLKRTTSCSQAEPSSRQMLKVRVTRKSKAPGKSVTMNLQADEIPITFSV